MPPTFKKIQDKTNYGNDGNAWALLVPSIFSKNGVYETDMQKPRPKEEIESIAKNCGIKLSNKEFDQVWLITQKIGSSNEVSLNDFWEALNGYKNKSF